MVDDGHQARDAVNQLRIEAESLMVQKFELEKEVTGKQTQSDMLDKAITTKTRTLAAEPGV
jgi:hypothetical protein